MNQDCVQVQTHDPLLVSPVDLASINAVEPKS